MPPNLLVDLADGVSYQTVARVIADAKNQGLDRIDFMSGR
jgi:biopolymer transport protein ExbD